MYGAELIRLCFLSRLKRFLFEDGSEVWNSEKLLSCFVYLLIFNHNNAVNNYDLGVVIGSDNSSRFFADMNCVTVMSPHAKRRARTNPHAS